MERKGICRNVGACSMANKVQIITDDDAEFICQECQSELEPVKENLDGDDDETKKKKRKRIISIVTICALVVAVGVCIYALTRKTGGGEPPKVSVTLNHTQKTLKVGESDTLKATVTPEGSQATYVWRASNKSNSVEVSSDGIVTAKEAGEGKVQVQAIIDGDTLKDVCVYTVIAESSQETLLSELSIIEGDFSLKVGDTKAVHYKAIPEQNNEQVTFESENSSVATVSAGVVKGIKAGKTKIVAISSKSGKTSFITVTVENKEVPVPHQNPSYGRYEGDRNSKGQPHGFGNVTFTRSKQVNSNTYAEPGYVIRNARYVNGKLQSGTLYDTNGNKVCFIDANNNL